MHIDKFLASFDHLPPFIDSFYLIKVNIVWPPTHLFFQKFFVTNAKPWVKPVLMQCSNPTNKYQVSGCRSIGTLKSNRPFLRPSKSNSDLIVVMKFEFCAHSTRLMTKLDHVLWILSKNTGLWQCGIEKKQRKFQQLAMICLYTLLLARDFY